MQSEGSNGSSAVLVQQQCMTLNKNQPTIDAAVGNKESVVDDSVTNGTISIHSRSHRAREREMLYRLGVTGCCSRVALSKMLRRFAESFATTALHICPKVLRPGPNPPNVPICRCGCRVVPIFAFFPDAFGPGPKPPKAVVEGRAASKQGVCFSAPLATKFGSGPEAMAKGRAAGPKLCFPEPVCSDFYVFLRAAW